MAACMNDNQRQLVTENIKLTYWAIKRYGARGSLGKFMDYDDIVQLASVALCNAALTYNGERGAFSTYAYTAMRNAFRVEYDKCTRRANFEMVDEEVEEIAVVYNEPERPLCLEQALEKAKSKCPNRVALGIDALMLRVSGHSLREVASFFNAPEANVAMWISRAKEKLKNDQKFLDAIL